MATGSTTLGHARGSAATSLLEVRGVLARPTTRCGTDRIKCGTGVPNLERAS